MDYLVSLCRLGPLPLVSLFTTFFSALRKLLIRNLCLQHTQSMELYSFKMSSTFRRQDGAVAHVDELHSAVDILDSSVVHEKMLLAGTDC